MAIQVSFVADEALSEMYYEGQLSRSYDFPYEDMDDDFSEQEIIAAIKIEKAISEKWGIGMLDASYDSWADKATRTTIQVRILSKELVEILHAFIAQENFERCVFCLVMSGDLEDINSEYLGRFVIYRGGIIADEKMELIWSDKVGSE